MLRFLVWAFSAYETPQKLKKGFETPVKGVGTRRKA